MTGSSTLDRAEAVRGTVERDQPEGGVKPVLSEVRAKPRT